MRDCLFLVADKNIEAMIAGFLNRTNFHLSLGCTPFAFDAKLDLKVAHGKNDPGLYTMANELLQPYVKTHRRVVVVLDSDWSGSPGAEKIRKRIEEHCVSAGWSESHRCAVVIDPELENWIWQDNAHVAQALGANQSFDSVKSQLIVQKLWTNNATKPHQPKEAVEWVLRVNKIPRSSALYKNLAGKVSVKGCTDAAFLHLMTTLMKWFP